jgi:chromosomal replication initiator protein
MLISVQFLGPDDSVPIPSAPATVSAAGIGAHALRSAGAPIGEAGPRPSVIAEPAATVGKSSAAAALARDIAEGHGPAAVHAPRADEAARRLPVSGAHLSLALNPDYTFDNFVMGPTNRLAHAAALAVAEKPGRTYNPFFVHGSVGLGKTHLLQAVCLRILQMIPGTRIYFTSCEQFMTQFIEAVQAGEMSAFRHTFRDVDVLAIDDVHFLAKRDRTQEEFFHTFNALHQAKKQIILSSDAPPEEIPDLEDRLVSRFKWGLVSHIGPPCYETRIAILKNKARMRGFELGDDVASHIAAKIDSNIRELEGAIVKLQVLASVDKRSIDLELAMAALGTDSGPARADRQVQIQSIIEVVTNYYTVKLTDLQSKRRHRSVAIPRQVCMFLCRRHTRYSLEEIGGYFGGRDHTTVMHAVKTIESRSETDPEFAQVLRRLDEHLRMPVVS